MFSVKFLFCSLFNILCAIGSPAVVNISQRKGSEIRGNRLGADAEWGIKQGGAAELFYNH